MRRWTREGKKYLVNCAPTYHHFIFFVHDSFRPSFAFPRLVPSLLLALDVRPTLFNSPAEDIAFFADARRCRAQRDGPAHHLTLLHRTEIQAEGEKEAGIEDCGGRDRDDNTASAVDTPAPTPTSPTSTGASIPCKPERKKRVDENELLSSAPSRRSSHATTMPEDKAKGDEKETQEQEGTKIMRKGADPHNSTEGVPRSFSSPSSSMDRYKDDDKDEAFASALLAMLTLLLNTNLLPHIPPLLYDPLPLYVYRTSGEGRALATSVLFLPGEWLRYWQGRVRRGGRKVGGGREGEARGEKDASLYSC